ncbi:MAG: hypothetical protein H7Z74_03745 [Anaerolineae bacterium]|nr:hypothetical protein [Gemmatimonadaceae bacterium]
MSAVLEADALPERTSRIGPRLWIRIVIACVAGAWGVGIVLTVGANTNDPLTHFARDFDQFWYGAYALREGINPYSVIGPGKAFDWPWPLYFPLPATLIALPFSFLPVIAARAAFFGGSSALLAFALTRDSYHRLVVFASTGYFFAGRVAQWEVALTAAALIPSIGFVFAAKPNIAIALLAAYPRKRAFIGIAVITGLSLVVMPSWPAHWLSLVNDASDKAPPVSYAAGIFLPLALLRWKRPEARLIAVLAFIPHTLMPYATIPLFLVPATLLESLLLVWATWIARVLVSTGMGPFTNFSDFHAAMATVFLPLVYLPVLVMVLRRPNEGEAPDWIVRGLRTLRPRRRDHNEVAPDGTSHAEEGRRSNRKPGPGA